jgi:ABC-type transport system involved in multi-copper enzyme maturation permease subunit
MTAASTSSGPPRQPRWGNFMPVLRAEWTKFRTVRGWSIGLAGAVVLTVIFTFLVANGTHEGGCYGPPPPGSGPNSPGSGCYVGHPFVPTGPDGEAVADTYYFVSQPLTRNGTITAQVTSLTGVTSTRSANVAPSSTTPTRPELASWAKAGILLTPSTKQGSAYAAVMATGSHGIRLQYDYTHDTAALPGSVTATSPRWLRLTRTGETLTGYDSTNGTNWTAIGTAHLTGLPSTVAVGLFVTSPVSFQGNSSGAPTLATATFDHVSIASDDTPNAWRGQSVGTNSHDFYPTLGSGSYHRSGGDFVVSGSGDIAPAVALAGGDTASTSLEFGLVVALMVMIVIATMFITAEYRRGLIRTTFTATPQRGRVLAAKAIVIGAVAFVTGGLAAGVAIPLGEHILKANGNYVFPTSAVTELQIIVGSGAVLAVTAIAVLAVGTILRKSAGAVTGGIVVFVLPYVVGSFVSGGAEQWLYRLTPAAGFSVLGALPYSMQVSYPYTLANGYYPLAPWAGLAVLCGYSALALGLATFVLRRRDA